MTQGVKLPHREKGSTMRREREPVNPSFFNLRSSSYFFSYKDWSSDGKELWTGVHLSLPPHTFPAFQSSDSWCGKLDIGCGSLNRIRMRGLPILKDTPNSTFDFSAKE